MIIFCEKFCSIRRRGRRDFPWREKAKKVGFFLNKGSEWGIFSIQTLFLPHFSWKARFWDPNGAIVYSRGSILKLTSVFQFVTLSRA